MKYSISFVIPVYNRPDEIEELLESMLLFEETNGFEVVIIEDGSQETCEAVVKKFSDKLHISYYYKPNSGPGDSRNYGMQKASGDYFIILDSDVILPAHYLKEVRTALNQNYVDCFGGPDAADASFTVIQKAINFSMTSFITTGGIRGGRSRVNTYEPRSFNMGISKKAFEASGGFGRIHPGEDPDLSIRLRKLGFETQLFPKAYVFHKRRISWAKFYKQVHKFGRVRPILNQWHPTTAKVTYWFPLVFISGILVAILLSAIGIHGLSYLYMGYFAACFVLALFLSKNIWVGILSIPAVLIQFYGYGTGFLKSWMGLHTSKKTPEELFPDLFFKV